MPVYVTKPYLPERNRYQRYLDGVFDSAWLTNNGPLVQELTCRLQDYLGVTNLLLVNNATTGLMIAQRLLGITGRVLTTPFSFVATTSTLAWQNLAYSYADIDPATFNLDPENVRAALSSDVEAILSVHVFGNPCAVDEFAAIAKQHNLKIIYDAAHAFGVKYQGQSVLRFGDVSVLSFHATKLFHTIEGGALVINDPDLYEKATQMINFGYDDKDQIVEVGINAKMSEVHAAMGLSLLDEIDQMLERRQQVIDYYRSGLDGILVFQQHEEHSDLTPGYMPVLLPSAAMLLRTIKALNQVAIFPRRYFYPALDSLSYNDVDRKLPQAHDIASRVLCLPVYADLSITVCRQIVEIIKAQCRNQQCLAPEAVSVF